MAVVDLIAFSEIFQGDLKIRNQPTPKKNTFPSFTYSSALLPPRI
jgi:hypothetical protein